MKAYRRTILKLAAAAGAGATLPWESAQKQEPLKKEAFNL